MRTCHPTQERWWWVLLYTLVTLLYKEGRIKGMLCWYQAWERYRVRAVLGIQMQV